MPALQEWESQGTLHLPSLIIAHGSSAMETIHVSGVYPKTSPAHIGLTKTAAAVCR